METKDNKKNNKVKKIILITLCVAIVFFLLLVLANYIVCHDNKESSYVDKNTESTEIIKKNYIDGYSNTKEDGYFRFTLPSDDINQLLTNSLKEIKDERISSLTYELKDDHHYFIATLKPRLFKTRVVIDCVSFVDNVNKVVELQVVGATMGKLPILDTIKKDGYLSSTFVSKLSSYSLLPISFNDFTNVFKIEPLKFYEYFPTNNLSKLLINEAISSSNNVKVYSLFNFSLDMSSLRSIKHKPSKSHSTLIDPLNRVNKVVTQSYIDSILPGEEKKTLALTIDEYSDYFRSELSDNKESYTSSLTSNTLEFKLNDVYASLSVDKIKYTFNISINGYMADASISFNIKPSTYDAKLLSNIDASSFLLGDISKSYDSDVSKYFNALLEEIMIKLSDKYEFFDYASSNKLFTFDLSKVAHDLIGIDLYERYLKVNTTDLDRFEYSISLI